MKPLHLTIEGINSFIEPREVDFAQLSQSGIFCICGPTGSGKTTILDCVILALYAPSSHHRGTLKDYVNTKCDKGKITLDFSADGARYRVYREIRKTTSSTAKLTNLDTGEVLADKADTVTEAIKKMLRLDKEDFTKVVVLEQGRFAQFMQMSKSDRVKTVGKLFNLERFEKLKDAAASAKKKYERILGELDAALSQYDGVTEAALADKKKRAAECKAESDALRKEAAATENALREQEALRTAAERRQNAQKELAEAESEQKSVQVDRAALSTQKSVLDAQKAALDGEREKSNGAHALLAAVAACREEMRALDEAEEKRKKLLETYKNKEKEASDCADAGKRLSDEKARAEEVRVACSAQLLSFGFAAATEAEFAAAQATAKSTATRLTEAENSRRTAAEQVAIKESLYAKLLAAQNESTERVRAARTAAESAKSAYENARQHNAAAVVRGGLRDGDVCPVCGGTYHGGGAACEEDSTLGALRQRADDAAAALQKEEELLKQADIEHAQTEAALSQARKALSEAESRAVGSADDAQKAAAIAAKGLDAAKRVSETERHRTETESKRALAQKECDAIRQEGIRIREDIDARKARLSERLGGRSPDAAATEAQAAIDAYERKQKDWETQTEAVSAAQSRLAARESAANVKSEAAKKLLAELPAVPFDGAAYEALCGKAATLRDRLSALDHQMGGLNEQAEKLKEQLGKKKELARKKKETSAVADNVLLLNKCVGRDNPLLSFVAEEYVQSFTVAAADTLSSLTGGKYRLVYDDGEFYVEDFFADNSRRKVKTLSGGETFLASMSIAMAISRAIALQNYEFFFLDEGFGTLHERAMETVTAALKELSRETTVGIVTHRTELADRIPARLTVLPATEDTGSDVRFTEMG